MCSLIYLSSSLLLRYCPAIDSAISVSQPLRTNTKSFALRCLVIHYSTVPSTISIVTKSFVAYLESPDPDRNLRMVNISRRLLITTAIAGKSVVEDQKNLTNGHCKSRLAYQKAKNLNTSYPFGTLRIYKFRRSLSRHLTFCCIGELWRFAANFQCSHLVTSRYLAAPVARLGYYLHK